MENKYVWKLKGFAKGVDADLAVRELANIEIKYGSLTPAVILEAATPEESPLHSLFIWDDVKAAHLYRLRQATNILNNISVVTVTDGEQRQLSVYEVVRGENGNAYKHIDSFNESDIEQVKNRTIRDLNILRSKLALYQDFKPVTEKISETIETVSEINK